VNHLIPCSSREGNLSRGARTNEARVLVIVERAAVVGQMHRGSSPRAVERQVEGVRPSPRRSTDLVRRRTGQKTGEQVPRARS